MNPLGCVCTHLERGQSEPNTAVPTHTAVQSKESEEIVRYYCVHTCGCPTQRECRTSKMLQYPHTKLPQPDKVQK